ncbi:hypothetical protein H9P43_001025 [Blastocladiella emersonii ATCC 22665]|nr:hypothetical protein H9P43_001025 [Blastocladiella emersonii ATCC 22665]
MIGAPPPPEADPAAATAVVAAAAVPAPEVTSSSDATEPAKAVPTAADLPAAESASEAAAADAATEQTAVPASEGAEELPATVTDESAPIPRSTSPAPASIPRSTSPAPAPVLAVDTTVASDKPAVAAAPTTPRTRGHSSPTLPEPSSLPVSTDLVVPTAPTSPAGSIDSGEESDRELHDIDFDFWLDIADASVYDLIGSEWASEASRLLAITTGRIEKLDADMQSPLSAGDSDSTQKRRIRRRDRLAARVVSHWQILESKFRNPQITRTRDKVAFFFGVTNLWVTALIAGMFPALIPLWFTLKAVVLLSMRWGIYRAKRWHLFLADFCYLINSLVLVFIHVMPSSRALFHLLYACAHGPLAWAIVTWRNSLVFHSLDKMTSVFIHLSPPLTLAAMRWLDPTHSTAASPYYSGVPGSPLAEPVYLGITEALVGGTAIYAVWQLAYYLLILQRRRDKVYRQGYATSFTWLLGDSKGAISRAMNVFGERYQLVTFMALQYVYSMVTVIPAVLWSRSMILNLLFLVAILSASVWNAASFYIDVFSARYARDLANLEAEFKDRVQNISASAPSSAVPNSADGSESKDGAAKTAAAAASVITPRSLFDAAKAAVTAHLTKDGDDDEDYLGCPPGAWPSLKPRKAKSE